MSFLYDRLKPVWFSSWGYQNPDRLKPVLLKNRDMR
jgi:hypothetical protein